MRIDLVGLKKSDALGLRIEVDFGTNVGRIDGDMTEPGAVRIDIHSAMHQVAGGRGASAHEA